VTPRSVSETLFARSLAGHPDIIKLEKAFNSGLTNEGIKPFARHGLRYLIDRVVARSLTFLSLLLPE
jgi:hypothetical protein